MCKNSFPFHYIIWIIFTTLENEDIWCISRDDEWNHENYIWKIWIDDYDDDNHNNYNDIDDNYIDDHNNAHNKHGVDNSSDKRDNDDYNDINGNAVGNHKMKAIMILIIMNYIHVLVG